MAAVVEPAGGMKMTAINGMKVYAVSGQKSILPSLNPRSRKSRDGNQKVELVQDLQFDTAATHIKSTPDGKFLISSGVYPPQVKVYELSELSLKFERHLVSEIVDFEVLSEDYSKLAFLCADRSVCLHAKFGSYFSTRIPRMGRDIVYDKWSCDLLLAASSPELYRLNLEQGQFLAPLLTRSPGLNVVTRSSVHGLIACGGEDGAMECFDLRQRAAVGRIHAVGPTGDGDQEVTALRFDEREGMLIAAGTSNCQVLLYDLRSSKPLLIKDHMYGSPILDIKWHESVNTTSRLLVTTDCRVVRIWDSQAGNGITNIEPPSGDINDVCLLENSGLMFMALDAPQVATYFIPALGPAPKWCSFLENLTEELDETGQTTIYDDFKFVTKEDLERLNLTNLIGTNLLRAYMHGYFINHLLYAKAKASADPFAYDAYRKQRVQDKLESERAARITVKKKLPKVNRALASRMMTTESIDDLALAEGLNGMEEGSQKKKKSVTNLLEDDRFATMFKDEDFEVDMEAPEYKVLHPNAPRNKVSLEDEHLQLVDESDTDRSSESDESGSSSEEGERGKQKSRDKRTQKEGKQQPRLFEAKDDVHAQAFRSKQSLASTQNLPLGQRLAAAKTTEENSTRPYHARHGGSREVSFIPRGGYSGRGSQRGGRSGGRSGDQSEGQRAGPKKRGVESLGLNSFDKIRKPGRGRGYGLRGRGGNTRG